MLIAVICHELEQSNQPGDQIITKSMIHFGRLCKQESMHTDFSEAGRDVQNVDTQWDMAKIMA